MGKNISLNNKLKESFLKLSFDDKKEKLLILLNGFKDSDNVFNEIIIMIKEDEKLKDLTESFLITTYFNIIEFGEFVKNDNMGKASEKLLSLKDNLNDIKKQEALENEKVDDILDAL